MERTQEAGEILINSLLLLGTSLSQSSRDYGCEIRQDMFLQPNQKGLNSVFHLLLDRLKGREFIKKVSSAFLLQHSPKQDGTIIAPCSAAEGNLYMCRS